MANICCNEFVFYGKKEDVEAFYNVVDRAINNPTNTFEDADNYWIGNLFAEALGIKMFNRMLDKGTITCRGSFDDYGYLNVAGTAMYIISNTAWTPNLKSMRMLGYRFNLDVDCLAEEEGCEVFINTDLSREYFSENYAVVINDDEFEYYMERFKNVEDIIDYLADYLKLDKNEVEKFIGNQDIINVDFSKLTDKLIRVYEYTDYDGD